MPISVEEVNKQLQTIIHSFTPIILWSQAVYLLVSKVSRTISLTLQYHIGQLYMIARHSQQESGNGEGVEVVVNEPCSDPTHGEGQYTEKRIHLHK